MAGGIVHLNLQYFFKRSMKFKIAVIWIRGYAVLKHNTVEYISTKKAADEL
jgi:hypothetical protein